MSIHQKIVSDGSLPRGAKLKLPVPEDFSEKAHGASNAFLKQHYGVGDKTLAKWRKETGIAADTGRMAIAMIGPRPAPNDFKDHARLKTNRVLAQHYGVGEKTVSRWRKETGTTGSITPIRFSSQLPSQGVPAIEAGRASEAAQFLRKTHRPVYHRVIEGREFKGSYVVGTMVMNEAEIIAYAETKGFEPLAGIWKSRFE
jgi:hypothetical protein